MADVIHWEVVVNDDLTRNIECLTYEHAIVTAHAFEQFLNDPFYNNIVAVNEITDDGRRIELCSNAYGDNYTTMPTFRHANYPKIL
jgi:hypothetical protein